MENCTFWKTGQTGDALDFDGLDWGLINGCRFIAQGGGDNLIDLGSYCDSLTISNNLIMGALDKGVSIGEGSDVILTGNVIAHCTLGVAVKDNSFCLSRGNTFYGNDIAFKLYQKTSGMGGGRAEIFNLTDVAIDLSGWKFKDDSHSFVFPDNSMIDPRGYLVVAENKGAFLAHFPDVSPVLGDLDFGFSGGGERLSLTGPTDTVYDSVLYDDSPPWPVEPDGMGPTLELLHYSMDNSLPASWTSSESHGTPGATNSNEVSEAGSDLPYALALTAFPNPFNPACELYFTLKNTSLVELSVYDLQGRKLVTLISEHKAPGRHRVTWDGRDEYGQQLASSVYFARLNIGTDAKVIKMTLVK